MDSSELSNSFDDNSKLQSNQRGEYKNFKTSHDCLPDKTNAQINRPDPPTQVHPDILEGISEQSPAKPPRSFANFTKPSSSSYNAYENEQLTDVTPSSGVVQTDQTSSGVQMRRQQGWQVDTDQDGTNYYTHPNSKEKWVKVDNEDGVSYYYEVNSRCSAWDLPSVEQSSTSPVSATVAGGRGPARSASSLVGSPTCITSSKISTIDLSEAQAKFGARKLPPSKSGDSLSSLTAQEESSSRFYRISKSHITGPIENKIRGTERRGQVNFKKIAENDFCLDEKWISATLLLMGPTLYVYRDSKILPSSPETSKSPLLALSPSTSNKKSESGGKFFSFISKNSNSTGKLEAQFHVKDVQISSTEKDTTFRLTYSPDSDTTMEYLVEAPSAELRKAWETALQYSQDFDKEDRFDRRALSTRPPPSVDQKVVAVLREFFRRRPTLESIRERGILKDEPVFGSNLIDLCRKEQTQVPTFVTRVIRAVEARGLETNGLYRRSGNGAAIQKLRNQVDHSEYSLNSDEWDIYELSDSLKLFLRELKEPLLQYALYDDFKEFSLAKPSCTNEQNIAKMRSTLRKLPACHYATAKMIIGHLNKVAAMESVNQMSAKNLALVFGPNMMWRDTPTDDYIRFSNIGCDCTEFLIINYDAVFAHSQQTDV